MTIDQVHADLRRLLPSFHDGKWQDASYHNVRQGPLLRVCRDASNTMSGPVLESVMDEHDMSVEEVLALFASKLPGIRTVKQWREV